MNMTEACEIMKALDPMVDNDSTDENRSVFNGVGLVCYAKANGWPIDADKLEAYEVIKEMCWMWFEKKWKEAE